MNVTKKDREAALAITGPCSCHEAYKSRGLTAPDCVFCDCAEGIADALAQARVDALETLNVEVLAAVEHEQWMAWSKSLSLREDLSAERRARWEKLWVPYTQLPEADKESDRAWARIAIRALKEKP